MDADLSDNCVSIKPFVERCSRIMLLNRNKYFYSYPSSGLRVFRSTSEQTETLKFFFWKLPILDESTNLTDNLLNSHMNIYL